MSEWNHDLTSGPLASSGGLCVVDDLLDRSTLAALTSEALDAGRSATRQVGASQQVDDGRNDVAGRALGSGPGGPVLDAFYQSTELASWLTDLCGAPVRPTGYRGSYSYYTRPGDHLDLHVDVDRCDVTVITVLHDSTSSDESGGSLVAWGDHLGQPLKAIRETGAVPTASCKPKRGSSVVLIGGLLPHALLPLGPVGSRVVAPLCFTAG